MTRHVCEMLCVPAIRAHYPATAGASFVLVAGLGALACAGGVALLVNILEAGVTESQ